MVQEDEEANGIGRLSRHKATGRATQSAKCQLRTNVSQGDAVRPKELSDLHRGYFGAGRAKRLARAWFCDLYGFVLLQVGLQCLGELDEVSGAHQHHVEMQQRWHRYSLDRHWPGRTALQPALRIT